MGASCPGAKVTAPLAECESSGSRVPPADLPPVEYPTLTGALEKSFRRKTKSAKRADASTTTSATVMNGAPILPPFFLKFSTHPGASLSQPRGMPAVGLNPPTVDRRILPKKEECEIDIARRATCA
jgi:hypothetical protein